MIVWGTKVTTRRMGYVAEFCPICRGVRPLQVDSVNSVGHLYFIPLGRGKVVCYRGRCADCGLLREVDPLAYLSFAGTSGGSIQALVAETFPGLADVYAERLAFEDKLRERLGSLSGDERTASILEPFEAIAPMVEGRTAVEFDRKSGWGCALTFIVPSCFLVAAAAVRSAHLQSVLLIASAVAFGLGTVVTAFFLATGPSRYIRERVLPMLVRSLRPLKPTEAELAQALDKMAGVSLKVGRKLKPQQILDLAQRRAL